MSIYMITLLLTYFFSKLEVKKKIKEKLDPGEKNITFAIHKKILPYMP